MDKLSPAEQENANFVNNVIAPNSSPMPPFPVEGSTEAQDLLRKLEEKVKYGEYTASRLQMNTSQKRIKCFRVNKENQAWSRCPLHKAAAALFVRYARQAAAVLARADIW